MARTRTFLCFVLLAVATTSQYGSAQQTPPQTDPPTFRSSINFVEVDLIVTGEDGKPVTDLRLEDFQLTEDGKTQEIEQFRFVSIEDPPADAPEPRPIRSAFDEEREAAREDVRLFGIFFDDRGRGIGLDDVKRVRSPLIRFVQTQLRPADMVTTAYWNTPLIAMEFTRDREKTISEVEKFSDELIERRERELRLRLNNPNLPRDPLGSLNGLKALAAKMATLREGRKSIIYVGPGVANAFSTSFIGGKTDFDELTTTLNRSNISVYVLDPRGLSANGLASEASLRELAAVTGGLAIVDTNNLEEGLDRVASDAGVYYLLGYTSPAPADGKFHEIKVRVKRPGIRIRGRSGYWAYTPEALKRATTPPKQIAGPVMNALGTLASSADTSRSSVRSWTGASRQGDGQAQVTVAWEASAGAGARVSAVTVAATNRAGVEVFSNREVIVAGATGRTGRAATGRVAFGADPGPLQVKVSFEDAAGESIDADVRSLVVPDFSGSDPAFSTPQVFRAANAREFGLFSADPTAVPAVGRDFSRTDRLLVRFDSYRPGAEPRARVLNRQGNPMFDLPVARAAVGATHQIDLLLNRVPAGEYLIELRSGDSGQPELIALRVR